MLESVKVLGVDIDNLDSDEILGKMESFIRDKRVQQIVTVNTEFLVASQKDQRFRAILSKSSINTADSVGVLWAAKFLSLPLITYPILDFLQALWQTLYTGLSIVFYPSYIRSVLKEKNSGSELIWKIAEKAAQNGFKIFLLGGYGDTPKIVEDRLREKFASLQVVGANSWDPDKEGIIEKIKARKPDILMVAYGSIKQEKWIEQNQQNLGIPVAIGLGGTFDYMAGKRPSPPQILRDIGLEWAFRLVTQPYRLKRIITAVPVFIWLTIQYKLQIQKPYRENVAAAVIRDDGKILICKRISGYKGYSFEGEHWQIPQGGIEKNETLEQALARELEEEVGITEFKNLGEIYNAHSYDWPIKLARESYYGKYRGQRQNLVFIRVPDSVQLRLDQKEFGDYKWVDVSDLRNLVHPVRHRLADEIYDNFEKFVK